MFIIDERRRKTEKRRTHGIRRQFHGKNEQI